MVGLVGELVPKYVSLLGISCAILVQLQLVVTTCLQWLNTIKEIARYVLVTQSHFSQLALAHVCMYYYMLTGDVSSLFE